MTASSDYARVERVIRYIAEHSDEQPSLKELAHLVNLSEFHFQRLFQRWAGVTPKSLLQCVTLGRAKALLRDSRSLLEASLAVGLSGTSRLYDLFLQLEAMTPGEYKALARGLTIRWGIHPSPFGDALFALTDRGLCRLSFVGDDAAATIEELRTDWPGARLVEAPVASRALAGELRRRLRGAPDRPLPLLLKGTPFQLKVWEALLSVPEGAVTSYQSLASAIGQPRATRAVGSAIAANPIALLIPCHRVLRATGQLGDYRWGPVRKRAVLALEQARLPRAVAAR